MAMAAVTDRQRFSGVSKRLRTCCAAIAAKSRTGRAIPNGLTRTAISHSRRQACKERAGCQVGNSYLPVDQQLPGRALAGGKQPAKRIRK